MGRAAWHANSRFRDALKEVDSHFAKRTAGSLVDLLFADDLAPRLRRATYAQPLLLALQVATVRALEDNGITPVATLGHSVGEIAAAWCAGALSLEQAIDVIIARSRHLESIRGHGAMAALLLSEREARRFLTATKSHSVDIAAINSWRSVTISGPVDEIERLVTAAGEAKIGARQLDLDYPYHSALVDPLRGPLHRELAGLSSLPARRNFVSSTTGTAAGQENLGAEHWWRNMREPVKFESGLMYLLNEGVRIFVEIGPKPILGSYVRDALRDANTRGTVVQTLREVQETDDDDPIERAVSRVFIAGGQIDGERFFGPAPSAPVSLPLYPWRHTQFKIQPTAEAAPTFLPPRHPLLGSRPRQDTLEWSPCGTAPVPWIADHSWRHSCFPQLRTRSNTSGGVWIHRTVKPNATWIS